jgi:hypothetical protein
VRQLFRGGSIRDGNTFQLFSKTRVNVWEVKEVVHFLELQGNLAMEIIYKTLWEMAKAFHATYVPDSSYNSHP